MTWRRWFSNKLFSLHGRSGIGPWDIMLEKLRGRAGTGWAKRTEAVGTAEPRGSIRSPQKKMNRRPKIGGVLSLERLGIPHAI